MVKLSSPDTPNRLTVECRAFVGQLFTQSVVGRATFTREDEARPHVTVLGEPLM